MRSFPGILLLLILTISSCKADLPKPVLIEVSGKVTFSNSPVEKGLVSFISKDGKIGDTAELGTGGTYTLKVSPGEFQVTITPRLIKLPDSSSGPGGEELEKVKDIPVKYHKTESSGFKASVSESNHQFDFQMN